jgi:hypothetical protein
MCVYQRTLIKLFIIKTNCIMIDSNSTSRIYIIIAMYIMISQAMILFRKQKNVHHVESLFFRLRVCQCMGVMDHGSLFVILFIVAYFIQGS